MTRVYSLPADQLEPGDIIHAHGHSLGPLKSVDTYPEFRRDFLNFERGGSLLVSWEWQSRGTPTQFATRVVGREYVRPHLTIEREVEPTRVFSGPCTEPLCAQ